MTDIRSVDHENIWALLVAQECGVNYEDELNKEIIDIHLNQLIHSILDTLVDIDVKLIGFQILGVIILKTGAQMPDIVKYAVLFSTEWDYDRLRRWSKLLENDRKENLKKFRQAVLNYEPGNPVKISF